MRESDLNPLASAATASEGNPSAPASAHHAGEGEHVPVLFSKGSGRRLLIAVGTLALLLLIGVVLVKLAHHRAAVRLDASVKEAADLPPSVDVVRVEYAAPVHILMLPGEVNAFYQTTLYARTSGYLKKWNVDIGDKVKVGQLLATIESPDVEDQLTAARAKLSASTADVGVAQAGADFARISAGRYSGAEEGVVSLQERDEKKAGLESADAKLAYAKAQIKLDEAEVQRLTTLTSFQKVVAPFDGIITQRRVDIGDLVTAGSTTNTTPLFTIVQADQVRVMVDVPQSAAAEVHVGMQATLHAEQYPGRVFTGSVDRTAGALNPASKTLRVEVLTPNADLVLMPGMYVQVSFETSRLKPPLRVPAAAMAFRSTGPQVTVVDSDGAVHAQKVKIARDLGDFIEVQSGLKPDDRVALNLGADIADGDHITPIEKPVAPVPARTALVTDPARPASATGDASK